MTARASPGSTVWDARCTLKELLETVDGQPARDVVLPIPSLHRQAPLGPGQACARTLAAFRAPALSSQPALLAPDLRLETPGVGRVQDAGVAAIADGDLAGVHVHAGDGSVVGALHRGDGVANHRHPPAVDALERGLHGHRVRVRVPAPATQPKPANLRKVQPVGLDAHVLGDRHAVAAAPAPFEAGAAGLAPEEALPGVGLVLEGVTRVPAIQAVEQASTYATRFAATPATARSSSRRGD